MFFFTDVHSPYRRSNNRSIKDQVGLTFCWTTLHWRQHPHCIKQRLKPLSTWKQHAKLKSVQKNILSYCVIKFTCRVWSDQIWLTGDLKIWAKHTTTKSFCWVLLKIFWILIGARNNLQFLIAEHPPLQTSAKPIDKRRNLSREITKTVGRKYCVEMEGQWTTCSRSLGVFKCQLFAQVDKATNIRGAVLVLSAPQGV